MIKLQYEDIENLVDEPFFSRGEGYFKDRMVHIISISDNSIIAKVVGSRVYTVELVMNDGELEGECSCPAFADYGACKHIVAAGLAAIASREGKYKPSRECMEMMKELEKFHNMLFKKDKNELISIIIKLSDYYPEIIYEILDEEDDFRG